MEKEEKMEAQNKNNEIDKIIGSSSDVTVKLTQKDLYDLLAGHIIKSTYTLQQDCEIIILVKKAVVKALMDKFRIIPKSDSPGKHVEEFSEEEIIKVGKNNIKRLVPKLKWRGEK